MKTIPDNATIVPREDGDIVLAHGEVTGHRHRIPHRSAVLYRDENDARYLRGTAPMRLLHEEHGKIVLPAGDYLCVIQRVWTDADEAINVETIQAIVFAAGQPHAARDGGGDRSGDRARTEHHAIVHRQFRGGVQSGDGRAHGMAERQRALYDPDRIPQGIMSSITRYVEHGTHPGSCVEAILSNNLREAFARADVSTAEVMPAIVSYLYHRAPAVAWGSEEAVAAWMGSFAEKR